MRFRLSSVAPSKQANERALVCLLKAGVVPFATILLITSLAACSSQPFSRFMDHPILSWLPLDKWGVVTIPPDRRDAPVSLTDQQCLQAAHDRADVLDPEQFDAQTRRFVLMDVYRDCVSRK